MSVQTPALSPPAFSCTLELGKALGALSLASPGVLLPRQEQALWDQSRPQKESLLPPVSPALGEAALLSRAVSREPQSAPAQVLAAALASSAVRFAPAQ